MFSSVRKYCVWGTLSRMENIPDSPDYLQTQQHTLQISAEDAKFILQRI